MLSVFDTYVDSILSYGSEVWVFHHIQFCKRLPGVWKGTCNDFIFSELERFPLQIIIKLRIFKYWTTLRNTKNIILRAVYEDMEQYKDGWLMKVKQELCYIWNLPKERRKYFI